MDDADADALAEVVDTYRLLQQQLQEVQHRFVSLPARPGLLPDLSYPQGGCCRGCSRRTPCGPTNMRV